SCADGLAGTGLGSRLHPRRGRRQRAGAFVPRRSCGQPRVLPQLARVAVAAILALRGGEKKRTQRGVNCRACSGLGRSPGSKKRSCLVRQIALLGRRTWRPRKWEEWEEW